MVSLATTPFTYHMSGHSAPVCRDVKESLYVSSRPVGRACKNQPPMILWAGVTMPARPLSLSFGVSPKSNRSDLTKVVVGGWIAALGNVIGFYFGVRSAR